MGGRSRCGLSGVNVIRLNELGPSKESQNRWRRMSDVRCHGLAVVRDIEPGVRPRSGIDNVGLAVLSDIGLVELSIVDWMGPGKSRLVVSSRALWVVIRCGAKEAWPPWDWLWRIAHTLSQGREHDGGLGCTRGSIGRHQALTLSARTEWAQSHQFAQRDVYPVISVVVGATAAPRAPSDLTSPRSLKGMRRERGRSNVDGRTSHKMQLVS